MTRPVILDPDEWAELRKELMSILRDEAHKVRDEVHEGPMTAKETAKYLKCHVNHVYKNWIHLRHVVKGTPYWYRDEIDNFIKQK